MKDQHRAVRLGELPKGLVNPRPQLCSFESFGRIDRNYRHLTFDPAEFFIQMFDRFCALAFLLSPMIKAEVDHDARHPSDEAGFALELFQPLPALDPRF